MFDSFLVLSIPRITTIITRTTPFGTRACCDTSCQFFAVSIVVHHVISGIVPMPIVCTILVWYFYSFFFLCVFSPWRGMPTAKLFDNQFEWEMNILQKNVPSWPDLALHADCWSNEVMLSRREMQCVRVLGQVETWANKRWL